MTKPFGSPGLRSEGGPQEDRQSGGLNVRGWVKGSSVKQLLRKGELRADIRQMAAQLVEVHAGV